MAKTAGLRFITLEGGEGTGKSTLQQALVARLQGLGFETVATREPGGTPLAEAVRELALYPPGGQTWSPMAEALLMNAARRDHLEKLIRPSLEAGKWVICDRFSDSTRVYQSVRGGVAPDILRSMEKSVLEDTVPGLTLVLDAPIDTTTQRRETRSGAKDAFEQRNTAFHQAVRQAFFALAKAEPGRCQIIDASRPVEDVLEQAWEKLCAVYGLQENA